MSGVVGFVSAQDRGGVRQELAHDGAQYGLNRRAAFDGDPIGQGTIKPRCASAR